MAINKIEAPDSVSLFKPFWLCWRFLGILAWQNGDIAIMIFDIFLNIFMSLWYPIHLTVGLFLMTVPRELVKNLSMTISAIVCTIKYYCLRRKFKQNYEIMELFKQLDERANSLTERTFFAEVSTRNAKLLMLLYFVVYTSVSVAGVLSALLSNERRLMYPAWFPFDWQSSASLYYLAVIYQFMGMNIIITQNFTNDAMAPVSLCLISGHIRLLAMRVARIGYDGNKSNKENVQLLKDCIDDHIKLIRLFKVVENTISFTQLCLFISSGLNNCVALVYIVFFADNSYDYIYYSLFIFALGVELFPIYYYGSLMQQEFNDLPYAIFSSNWPDQSKSYRKICLIFAEVSLRKLTMLAGGVIDIQLSNFFAICKMTYSLFAVVIRLK